MILIDPSRKWGRKRQSYSHLVSDSSFEELHSFAEAIGISRIWFHKDHYDLRDFETEMAITGGAVEVSSRELATRRVKKKKK